jgi:LmbE family N-acetylglucosaminyl deacetylase
MGLLLPTVWRDLALYLALGATALLLGPPARAHRPPAPQLAHGSLAESPGLPPLGAETSLLVVSPHPDDETLCCAGVIRRVIESGGRASIVWLTSGDGSELDLLFVEKTLRLAPQRMRDLARRRMAEARAAAAVLGVPPARQFFLGYPDGGLLMLMTDNFVTPYASRFTGATRVPYSEALFPGHPYTGASLERDFESVLERVRPTLVLAPSPLDAHPDHRAAGILTLQVMSRRHELSRVRYWIVHGGLDWPWPRGLRMQLPLRPPPRGRGLDLVPFRLDAAEEADKLAAVRVYHTQLETMAGFLLSFVRETELYSASPMPLGRPLEARVAARRRPTR